eukprot:CAMPEP_0182553156 /NCGR_PEP_ID=MMETSP1323-20130603/49341_1 /TAXON_ID=236787 /ORGANISM="Florenciella parvula, Strain RCC1693" /LENGTH=122 /DNA_ID=CAMNT_0024764869 /DNA_START=393 /DNA_END=757 /DNA_ORIENTATION=+
MALALLSRPEPLVAVGQPRWPRSAIVVGRRSGRRTRPAATASGASEETCEEPIQGAHFNGGQTKDTRCTRSGPRAPTTRVSRFGAPTGRIRRFGLNRDRPPPRTSPMHPCQGSMALGCMVVG